MHVRFALCIAVVADRLVMDALDRSWMHSLGLMLCVCLHWCGPLLLQGRCPFTKQPLKAEQVTVLTKSNIERFRDRIAQ
jgi:hypothetical protein